MYALTVTLACLVGIAAAATLFVHVSDRTTAPPKQPPPQPPPLDLTAVVKLGTDILDATIKLGDDIRRTMEPDLTEFGGTDLLCECEAISNNPFAILCCPSDNAAHEMLSPYVTPGTNEYDADVALWLYYVRPHWFATPNDSQEPSQ